jgi:hypothetical protein
MLLPSGQSHGSGSFAHRCGVFLRVGLAASIVAGAPQTCCAGLRCELLGHWLPPVEDVVDVTDVTDVTAVAAHAVVLSAGLRLVRTCDVQCVVLSPSLQAVHVAPAWWSDCGIVDRATCVLFEGRMYSGSPL